jgi:hypothetical protein
MRRRHGEPTVGAKRHSSREAIHLPFVMAGLDPAIHPLRKNFWKMDTRVKPAYDAFFTGLLRHKGSSR